MDREDKVRAFIGITIPEDIKKTITAFQVQLQKNGISASWSKPDTMHLTLKFLGNVTAGQIESIKSVMARAAEGISTHSLSFSGIGVFPSVSHPRVLWTGTRGETRILEKLANQIDTILFEEIGIFKENRRFSSHLTLARIKQRIDPKRMINLIQAFRNFDSREFLISDIQFFQSELKSSGAVHRILFSTQLND